MWVQRGITGGMTWGYVTPLGCWCMVKMSACFGQICFFSLSLKQMRCTWFTVEFVDKLERHFSRYHNKTSPRYILHMQQVDIKTFLKQFQWGQSHEQLNYHGNLNEKRLGSKRMNNIKSEWFRHLVLVQNFNFLGDTDVNVNIKCPNQ